MRKAVCRAGGYASNRGGALTSLRISRDRLALARMAVMISAWFLMLPWRRLARQ